MICLKQGIDIKHVDGFNLSEADLSGLIDKYKDNKA